MDLVLSLNASTATVFGLNGAMGLLMVHPHGIARYDKSFKFHHVLISFTNADDPHHPISFDITSLRFHLYF